MDQYAGTMGDPFQELRQRVRHCTAEIEGSLGRDNRPQIDPFLRALVALNNAACASDQPELVILADAINKLFTVEVRIGTQAVVAISRGMDREYGSYPPRKGAGTS